MLGPRRQCILLPLPLFHVYAQRRRAGAGVRHAAIRSRWCRIRATLPDLLATIRGVKPAFFNGVPTLYVALLNHPDVQQRQGRLQVDQDLLLRRGAR